MTATRHFLTLNDLNSEEFRGIIARATELKKMQREGISHPYYPKFST